MKMKFMANQCMGGDTFLMEKSQELVIFIASFCVTKNNLIQFYFLQNMEYRYILVYL